MAFENIPKLSIFQKDIGNVGDVKSVALVISPDLRAKFYDLVAFGLTQGHSFIDVLNFSISSLKTQRGMDNNLIRAVENIRDLATKNLDMTIGEILESAISLTGFERGYLAMARTRVCDLETLESSADAPNASEHNILFSRTLTSVASLVRVEYAEEVARRGEKR